MRLMSVSNSPESAMEFRILYQPDGPVAQRLEQPRMLSGLVPVRNAIIFDLNDGPVAQRLEQGTHNCLATLSTDFRTVT